MTNSTEVKNMKVTQHFIDCYVRGLQSELKDKPEHVQHNILCVSVADILKSAGAEVVDQGFSWGVVESEQGETK